MISWLYRVLSMSITVTLASLAKLGLIIAVSSTVTTMATMRQTFSYGIPCPENRNLISFFNEFTIGHSYRHTGNHALLRVDIYAHLKG